MSELLKESFLDNVNKVLKNVTIYSTAATLFLYIFGYISLRFRLTFLGTGTDLSVIDERYLFEGARFSLYILTSIPVALLIILFISIPFFIIKWTFKKSFGARLTSVQEKLKKWYRQKITRDKLIFIGIIFSTLSIQLVMRQSLYFNNLLLRENLPEPALLHKILLSSNDAIRISYIIILQLLILLSAYIFYLTIKYYNPQRVKLNFMQVIFGLLIIIQIIFLPVNYGILIGTNLMAKVNVHSEYFDNDLNKDAWLIWEGQEGVTFFALKNSNGDIQKSMVTIPKKDIKRIEIIKYDRLLNRLFKIQ